MIKWIAYVMWFKCWSLIFSSLHLSCHYLVPLAIKIIGCYNIAKFFQTKIYTLDNFSQTTFFDLFVEITWNNQSILIWLNVSMTLWRAEQCADTGRVRCLAIISAHPFKIFHSNINVNGRTCARLRYYCYQSVLKDSFKI